MVEILTSLHGRRVGLSADNRLIINMGMGAAAGGLQCSSDGVIYTNAAPSTAVTTTTTETMFDKFATIPANALIPGTLIRCRFQGIATATNSTDTLAIKLYLATVTTAGSITGTALLSQTATDVANSDVFQGEYELIIRTIGASGTMVGCGTYKSVPAAEGTATYKDDILASTTVDTTVAQYLGVSATWSTNNAGNSCRLDFMRVVCS